MNNPFLIREIPLLDPFCNREKELAELSRHATNHMNVVLYSHRRFGKTSLAKRVMANVQKRGMIPIYVDIVGVSGLEDLVGRIAAKTYEHVKKNEPLFSKLMKFLSHLRPVMTPDPESGIKITVEPSGGRIRESHLEETLIGIKKFSDETKSGCFIVFDEFQDIAALPNAKNIEGRMRSQIQQHRKIAYLFIGSRRRTLVDMFENKNRSFYHSALLYPLKKIEASEFSQFIQDQFKRGKKSCSSKAAQRIIKLTQSYPYYAQMVAYYAYECGGESITEDEIGKALELVIEREKPLFETMIQGLSHQQLNLLSAVAHQPTNKVFSKNYMNRFKLGSLGSIQNAFKKLTELDYIEMDEDKYWQAVDPMLGYWLNSLSGFQ